MFKFIDSDFVLDFYQRLQIARNASKDEIHDAYRKRAFETHPDRNPNNKNAHADFIAVSRAYEVLNDPNFRAQYDDDARLGSAGTTFNKEASTDNTNVYNGTDFERYAHRYNHFKKTYGYTDEMIKDYISACTRMSTGYRQKGDLSTMFNFNAGSLKPKAPAFDNKNYLQQRNDIKKLKS